MIYEYLNLTYILIYRSALQKVEEMMRAHLGSQHSDLALSSHQLLPMVHINFIRQLQAACPKIGCGTGPKNTWFPGTESKQKKKLCSCHTSMN